MAMAMAPDEREQDEDEQATAAEDRDDADDLAAADDLDDTDRVADDDTDADEGEGADEDEDDDLEADDPDHLTIDTGLGVDDLPVHRHDRADDDAIAAFEAGGSGHRAPMDAPPPVDPPDAPFDPPAAFDAPPYDPPPFEPPPFEPPVPARSDVRARLDRLTGFDPDLEPAAPEPDGFAPAFGHGDQAATAAPRPLPKVLGLVALALVIVGGGYLLVRWGTPSGESPATSAANTAPAPDAPAASPAPSAPGPASANPATQTDPAAAPAPATPAPAATPPATKAATEPPVKKEAAPPPAAPTAPPAKKAVRPAPAPARSGRLLVRSNPAGAEVFVNGTRRGVTPLALRDLALGGYDLRINRAGFTAAEQRVTLDAGRTSRTVDVTLRRSDAAATTAPAPAPAATGTGSLLVDSRPPGARVTIDGREAGVTPLTVGALPTGPHSIRIDLAGYQPISTTTRVEPGVRARVAVSLTVERPE
jgi:hypothetical protein